MSSPESMTRKKSVLRAKKLNMASRNGSTCSQCCSIPMNISSNFAASIFFVFFLLQGSFAATSLLLLSRCFVHAARLPLGQQQQLKYGNYIKYCERKMILAQQSFFARKLERGEEIKNREREEGKGSFSPLSTPGIPWLATQGTASVLFARHATLLLERCVT